MKPDVPEVKLRFDKERSLRLDFYAVREFKRLTREAGLGPIGKWDRPEGISLLGYEGRLSDLIDEETLPILITACLLHEDPDLVVDMVARTLTAENLEQLAESLLGLLSEFFELSDGEPGEDSPEKGPPSPSSGPSGDTTSV